MHGVGSGLNDIRAPMSPGSFSPSLISISFSKLSLFCGIALSPGWEDECSQITNLTSQSFVASEKLLLSSHFLQFRKVVGKGLVCLAWIQDCS